MKTTMTENLSKKSIKFPCIMKFIGNVEFKNNNKELVIMFFKETRGMVIHEKGSDHFVGKVEDWIECSSKNDWMPFVGTIEFQ